MAASGNKVEIEKEKEKEDGGKVGLKHLGLVRIWAINALVCVSNLYDYAKQNSSPLKPAIGAVENAVSTVIGPVCRKFHAVPDALLVFLDSKVDEGVHKFDEHAPPLAKKAVSKVHSAMQKVYKVGQDLVREAQVGGSQAAIRCAGTLCKQLVLTQLATAWYGVNKYLPHHTVAQMAVSTAAHWSEKYNQVVLNMTKKGYAFFSYIPLVPVDEMTKAYKQVETAAAKKKDAVTSSDTE